MVKSPGVKMLFLLSFKISILSIFLLLNYSWSRSVGPLRICASVVGCSLDILAKSRGLFRVIYSALIDM